MRNVLRLPTRGALEPVPAGVDEDPIEPRLETRGVAQRGPLAPRLDIRVVRRVLGLGGVAQDRSCKSIRRVEMALREARECRGAIIGLPTRDGAAICHGHLERLAHDDMTNGGSETFSSAIRTAETLAALASRGARSPGPVR